ncbi:autotransporter assembly complex protein TamA [Desulfogranum mediterraneum]|uniref:autotransporter assembly complex protein TamA n=1 Tax=Desulfogranum mediterraneum TaxID=160661 RepID=UPI000402CE64|nr:autotransporter assembly complex family protein [Desulfogranum mediterraneum]
MVLRHCSHNGPSRAGSLLPALLSLLLLCCCLPNLALAQTGQGPRILLHGLPDELRENALASLSLKKYQQQAPYSSRQLTGYLNKAPREIERALQPFGYYSPRITIERELESQPPVITIRVEPGPTVRVEQVTINCPGEGCEDPWLRQLLAEFPLGQGDILDQRLYTQGKQRLATAALNQGYQQARFSRHRIDVRRQEASATITLTLELGPRYYFGPITFECDFLDHGLLERIAPSRQGDPFSPRLLTRMRQSLLASGYFATAEARYDLDQARGRQVPITMLLTPGVNNRYGAGLGYGTDTGFRGRLDWYNQRLNRYGHQLDIQLQPSQRKSHFGGVYTIPISNPKKERLSLVAKWENENFDNTETKGWNSTIGYDRLTDKGELSLFVRFLDEDFVAGLDSGHATVLSPGALVSWRWTDNRIRADHGLSLSARLIGGDHNLLSDTTFTQGTLQAKGILSLFRSLRLISRGEIGATAADEFYALPPSLRFYAGGDQSVRGYGYKRIGPEDAAGNVIGGRYLLTYSLELEQQLFGEWGAALFFDSGTASNSWDELRMRQGAGIGLRWSASFGQLRLDIAKALDQGNCWRLHFTMGADF